MSRRRLAGRSLLLALAALVVLGALVGWRSWQVRSDLFAAKADASRLKAAADARDIGAARAALEDLRRDGARARGHADSPLFRPVTWLPVVGDDAAAVRTLSGVLDDVASRGAAPLLDLVDSLQSGGLRPRNGSLPVDQIERLAATAADSSRVLTAADQQVRALTPDDYVGALREAVLSVGDDLHRATTLVRRSDTVLQVLPGMLGAEGPRRYLLVLQNNAEIRSTGGFGGSTFLLSADRGTVTLGDSLAGAKIMPTDAPVLPLSPAERRLFGEEVGTRFVNANYTWDAARAMRLWARHYTVQTGTRVDGVIATDPVMLSYLLGVAGPVDVDGVHLTGENVVAELLSGTYARLSDPDAQDLFFKHVGEAVVGRLFSISDVQGAVKALARGVDEGRMLVTSFDQREERVLAPTAVGGPFHDPAAAATSIGAFVDDTTGTSGSKLSFYLRRTNTARATTCTADGRQSIEATSTFRSTVPAGVALPPYVTGGTPGLTPGIEELDAYLVGPEGGSLDQIDLSGPVRQVGDVVELDGRPVAHLFVRLAPGAEAQARWTSRTRPGSREDVQLVSTPSVEPAASSATVPSAC